MRRAPSAEMIITPPKIGITGFDVLPVLASTSFQLFFPGFVVGILSTSIIEVSVSEDVAVLSSVVVAGTSDSVVVVPAGLSVVVVFPEGVSVVTVVASSVVEGFSLPTYVLIRCSQFTVSL